MMRIETSFPPASEAVIEQLNVLFKGALPQEYRDFLLQHDGCEIAMVSKNNARDWFLRFLSVNDVLQEYSLIEELYYENGEPQKPDSFPHIPIATDDNSNYLAYELRRSDNQGSFVMCLVDHEDYPYAEEEIDLFKRAENLNDLIEQLNRGVFAIF